MPSQLVGRARTTLWTPALITKAGWFDASDPATIIESGGFVSQWNDKSGNSRHLTQGTGSKQPRTGVRSLNGLNVLDFDGADYLSKSSWPAGTAFSIFIVAVIDVVNNASDAIFALSAAKDFGFIANHASQFNGALVCVGASNPSNTPLSGGPFPGPSIYNGSVYTSPLRIRGFVDGTMRADVAFIGGLSGTASLFVFADRTQAFSPVGAIGEIIAVASTTVPNRQKIEGYLAWKWGTQSKLPTSHPYKTRQPVV